MFRKVTTVFALALCAAGAARAAEEMTFQGGRALALRGLLAADSIDASLELVNRTQAVNRCTLALSTVDGDRIGPVMTLTLGPAEKRIYKNVFENMTAPGAVTEARAAFSCDQAFTASARQSDRSTGRTDLLAAEAVEENGLGENLIPELPAKALPCPTGALCLDAPGLVFVPGPPPGPPAPVGRVAFPAPAGAVKRFLLSLDVTVDEWYAQQPSGKHLIYWFVVNRNFDMPGLLYFRGPGKNEAFARHGVGLTHPQKIKVIKPFAAKVGHTYHVVNDYDMAGHKYTVTITDTTPGGAGVVLSSRPNVSSYTVKAGSNFLVDMGFYPGKVETEVPSYGWKYSNVHIETYK